MSLKSNPNFDSNSALSQRQRQRNYESSNTRGERKKGKNVYKKKGEGKINEGKDLASRYAFSSQRLGLIATFSGKKCLMSGGERAGNSFYDVYEDKGEIPVHEENRFASRHTFSLRHLRAASNFHRCPTSPVVLQEDSRNSSSTKSLSLYIYISLPLCGTFQSSKQRDKLEIFSSSRAETTNKFVVASFRQSPSHLASICLVNARKNDEMDMAPESSINNRIPRGCLRAYA